MRAWIVMSGWFLWCFGFVGLLTFSDHLVVKVVAWLAVSFALFIGGLVSVGAWLNGLDPTDDV